MGGATRDASLLVSDLALKTIDPNSLDIASGELNKKIAVTGAYR
jgi:hypothetical protein